MKNLLHKVFFRFKFTIWNGVLSSIRRFVFIMQGMKLGKGTLLPSLFCTWPHAVSIGSNCILERDIFFKVDGIGKPELVIDIGNHVFIGFGCEFNIRKKIIIGNDCLIASGCKFIDHDHGIAPAMKIKTQHGPEKEIIIGEDVWLGCNVVVLKGVIVNSGAVVAAGSVVTKSIPSNEIWAGVPAKKIGERKS